MKKRFAFTLMIFISFLSAVFIITSCKKNDDTSSSVATEPTVKTDYVSSVGQKWAKLSGTVNANNLTAEIYFEYGPTDSYGFEIAADPDTLSDNTNTAVSAIISRLAPGATYNYRVKALTISGITYGRDTTFTTTNTIKNAILFNSGLNYGSVTDIDGNTYKTIQIGAQIWMAENLNAITFNDKTPIPFGKDATAWTALSTPGYCWYNYDSVSYGALYNWYVVDAASNSGKNVCPSGWHVPDNTDWTALTTFLGGESIAGGKLKETGTQHWYSTDAASTNETGFTAIGAGYRYNNGVFNNIKRYSYWWSATKASSVNAYYRNIIYSFDNVENSSSNKKSGFSIRCLKDQIAW
jgi:uncharacterized protein (TIGR02145 family)